MILSTTPQIEGHTIREYKGIVTGETIIGANMFKDLFAGIRDIVGGRAGAYEKVLSEAKDGDDAACSGSWSQCHRRHRHRL